MLLSNCIVLNELFVLGNANSFFGFSMLMFFNQLLSKQVSSFYLGLYNSPRERLVTKSRVIFVQKS